MLQREAAATELRFVELLDGRNKILVVSAVAADSIAEKVHKVSPASLRLFTIFGCLYLQDLRDTSQVDARLQQQNDASNS